MAFISRLMNGASKNGFWLNFVSFWVAFTVGEILLSAYQNGTLVPEVYSSVGRGLLSAALLGILPALLLAIYLKFKKN